MKNTEDIRQLRGPLNGMIANAMRRDGIREVTKWADKWEIGRTTMYNLVRGRETESGAWVKPSLDTLVKLSYALKRPLHELVYVIEPDAPGANSVAINEIPVEIVGWCGAGPEQEFLEGEAAVFLPPAFAKGRKLSAFEVHGDSMDAGRYPIHHLDIVVVDNDDKGFNGAAVVARLDEGYVCKLLKVDKFGRNLYSANVHYTNGTPPAIPGSSVREIVGRVVKIISSVPPTPTDNAAL